MVVDWSAEHRVLIAAIAAGASLTYCSYSRYARISHCEFQNDGTSVFLNSFTMSGFMCLTSINKTSGELCVPVRAVCECSRAVKNLRIVDFFDSSECPAVGCIADVFCWPVKDFRVSPSRLCAEPLYENNGPVMIERLTAPGMLYT